MKRLNVSARRHLDSRLAGFRTLASQPPPHRGWVRAIREAIGMSTTELAVRMGVSQSRISAIEHGETQGTVKLETLRRAAEALDCDLVYVLVPRTTLAETVSTQARRKAASHIWRVGHHMRLEDQSVTQTESAEELDDFAARLIDRRGLWTVDQPS